MICNPTGPPSGVKPQGTEMAVDRSYRKAPWCGTIHRCRRVSNRAGRRDQPKTGGPAGPGQSTNRIWYGKLPSRPLRDASGLGSNQIARIRLGAPGRSFDQHRISQTRAPLPRPLTSRLASTTAITFEISIHAVRSRFTLVTLAPRPANTRPPSATTLLTAVSTGPTPRSGLYAIRRPANPFLQSAQNVGRRAG